LGHKNIKKNITFISNSHLFPMQEKKTIFAPPMITKNKTKAMLSNLSKKDMRREKQEKVFHTIIQVGSY